MSIRENIDALLARYGITQETLAGIAGISQAAVSGWRHGKTPSNSSLMRICDYFRLEPNDILSDTCGLAVKASFPQKSYDYRIMPLASDTYTIIGGTVHAGEPSEAIAESGEQLWISPEILEQHPNVYYLRVVGDSMNKVLPEGSMALVDKSATVGDGDIGVVFVNGDDVTIKRVFFAGNTIVLHPESTNPHHLDRAINERDPEAPEVRIEGKVIWYYPEVGSL